MRRLLLVALFLVTPCLVVAGCGKGDASGNGEASPPGPRAHDGRSTTAAKLPNRPETRWVPISLEPLCARAIVSAAHLPRRPLVSVKDVGGTLPHDNGALLTVGVGRIPAERLSEATVKATRRHTSVGHTYLLAPAPVGLSRRGQRGRWVSVGVKGEKHGVAVPRWGQAGAGSRLEILVRMVGPAPNEPVVLEWTETPGSPVSSSEKARIQQIRLDPGDAKQSTDLPAEFFLALAADAQQRSNQTWRRPSPFFSFASGRLRLLAGEKEGVVTLPDRARRSEIGDLMSLYTGMTSVEEALQADRGLRLRGSSAGRTIPIEKLRGVELRAHPWDEMLVELGTKPQVEPLSRAVPHDMAYAHFHDLRTAVSLAADLDRWVTPLMQLLEWRSGTSHMTQRYEQALMVQRTGLAKKLGHLAAKSVAICVGDPFLRDGADVALLFHVRNETILDSALGAFEGMARRQFPDLATQTYRIGPHAVRRTFTADRSVNQHRMRIGEILVIANSRHTIERFAAVAEGKAPSLASRGDFRYMRAVYPYSDEDSKHSFLFVGDDFVNNAVSPQTKILQARRMNAQADLMAVGYASLLYGWLEGKRAPSIQEVLGAGYLRREELEHSDGTPIEFSPTDGASSARFGRPAQLVPLAELELTGVSAEEEAAYGRFRDTYQRNWRGFIDPIAIRLVRDGRTRSIQIDGRMLPLIEGTEYDELIRLVGAKAVRIPRLDGAGQWTFAVGEESRLRRELDRLAGFLGMRDLHFGWLGDWVSVGVADRSGLWDMAVLAGEIPKLPESDAKPSADRQATEMKVVDQAPVYVAAHIRNPLSFAGTLAGIRAFVERVAPGMVSWEDGRDWRGIKTVNVVGRLRAEKDAPPVSLHYAIAGDVFVASPDEATLLTLVDRLVSGKGPTVATVGQAEAMQSWLEVTPQSNDSWLTRTAIGLLEKEVHQQHVATFRDLEILRRGFGGVLPGGVTLRKAGLGFLTFEPRSVQGGMFRLDDAGRIAHTAYGTRLEPVLQSIPTKGAPLTALVRSLKRLRMAVGFEGRGRNRGLHVTAEWGRR